MVPVTTVTITTDVHSSSQNTATNLQAGCPSCLPTNSVKTSKE